MKRVTLLLYLVIFYLWLFLLFKTIAGNFIEMAHMYYCNSQMGSAAGLRKSKRVKLPYLCLQCQLHLTCMLYGI